MPIRLSVIIPSSFRFTAKGSRWLALVCMGLVFAPAFATPVFAVRIKDLVTFEGDRTNALIGYGLVVGLDGTGDRSQNSPFTGQSLQTMLERLGVSTLGETLRTSNSAGVVVTAMLPSFAVQGSHIDVTVSALGDATSLMGGTLLVTPLIGADSQTYAVAQGPVSIRGYEVEGEAASVTQGNPTSGRVPNGAIVEREIDFAWGQKDQMRLILRNPDLTTARRVAETINRFFGQKLAQAVNANSVSLNTKNHSGETLIDLLAQIEQLHSEPDQVASVVIDEQAGVVVIGEEVRISRVAIAHGNLTVTISEAPVSSQPNPFSDGTTVVLSDTEVDVNEFPDRRLELVGGAVTLRELVDGLNALGVSPRSLVAILQGIKAAGALQANIRVM